MRDIVKFVNDRKELFCPEIDPSVRQTRNTSSFDEIVDQAYDTVEDFISKLWLAMRERFEYTDLSVGPTSFSEAPAESVFSVWERVSNGRKGLTISHTIALVRVAMEGPVASTKASFELSSEALRKYPGRHGQRFTTAHWMPGTVSQTVQKIQSK